MIVNSVLLQSYYSGILFKVNSNRNLNFEGLLKMGKDIRRCCGLYSDDAYTPFLNEWTKKLPEGTSIAVFQKNVTSDSEKYIVKSHIWDKHKLECKKCAEDEIFMDTEGISKYGTCCRWEDTYAIEDNKERLLECLNKHLNKIKTKLKRIPKT